MAMTKLRGAFHGQCERAFNLARQRLWSNLPINYKCTATFLESASHKSNPLSVTRGIVDLYSTLGHVGGGNGCGGYTLMGVAKTHAG
jgi:hypothetical protein